jgi:hypothetical protein
MYLNIIRIGICTVDNSLAIILILILIALISDNEFQIVCNIILPVNYIKSIFI